MEIACAGVLLDADGTLVDSTPAVERTWRVWAHEYGVDAAAVLRVYHGQRSEETIARFVPAVRVGPAVARLDELELDDLGDVVACRGAPELVARLAGAGPMPWAIVTSGIAPLVTARLAAAGLPRPAALVTAEDVTEGKPAPEAYRLAADRLGVRAEDCVVIEDAPAGVRSGRAAGAMVIAVTTTHPADALGEADIVVPTLHEIGVRTGVVSADPVRLGHDG